MIEKICIKNFKSISQLEISCNKDFNVLIGENNIGKTTIFEAIHLWKMCYDANIQKSNKKKFYASCKNIPFRDMEYLRVFEDKDLLNNPSKNDIDIVLKIEFYSEEFSLGFQITKQQSVDNSYLQISYKDYNEFQRFSQKFLDSDFNLTNAIVICESRPVANIIAKEPYMYKNQIMEKISKGKGYEVLRNKITKSNEQKEKIEEHLKNVMEKEYIFTEVDKENKTYIRLLVNGTNILSQGSGFLQVSEIFASLEYTKAGIYILLIDEPDSHLHMKLQKNLINEFRNITNSQLFVITHNDKFLDEISDSEIIFIDSQGKSSGSIEPLQVGFKNIVLKNLVGVVEKIDSIKYIKKIILLEGNTDTTFFNNILPKYREYTGKELPNVIIEEVIGIDKLNDKLVTLSHIFKSLLPNDIEWIVIRDTDCVPLNKIESIRREHEQNIHVSNKKIVFQNGYGIESTFLSEINKFASLIMSYYGILDGEKGHIIEIIERQNEFYYNRVINQTDNINRELEKNFERQKSNREGRACKDITFRDMLMYIDKSKIQYIMTKVILNEYLKDLHNSLIEEQYTIHNEALSNSTIMNFYYDSISSIDDIYENHIELLELLY